MSEYQAMHIIYDFSGIEFYVHTSIDDCFLNCAVVYSYFSTVRRASNRGKTGRVNFDRLMSNGRLTVQIRKLYAFNRRKKN